MDTSARTRYLQSFAPADRSEAAARYDHWVEAVELSPDSPAYQAEARARLRCRQQIDLLVQATTQGLLPYALNDVIDRLMRGRIISSGMQRAIDAALTDLTEPASEAVNSEAARLVAERREYLERRYRVSSLQSLGGRATAGISTPAKRRAARANGKLGGRPRRIYVVGEHTSTTTAGQGFVPARTCGHEHRSLRAAEQCAAEHYPWIVYRRVGARLLREDDPNLASAN